LIRSVFSQCYLAQTEEFLCKEKSPNYELVLFMSVKQGYKLKFDFLGRFIIINKGGEKMSIQKNNTLELLKLLASYMVVFIHVSFYGKIGVIADALARFAVPFFFLVSGFYSYQIPCEKIKKRIRNILTLLIFAAICYNIFEIATLLCWNTDGLVARFNKYTDLSTFINLLIFNMPVSSGHLWYLLAIFYVYVIFYFSTMLHVKDKAIFIISLFLLFLHVLLGEGLSILGIVLPFQFVRNFAVMGIPFFALGLFVKKHEHKFKTIPDYVIFMSLIIGVFESILSRCIFGANELYIGSLFILFATICTFNKYANVKYPSFLTTLEGCSTYIYIFHIIISSVIHIAYGVLGINIYSSIILENLHPLIVCIGSTIFAYFLIKILKKLQKQHLTS